LPPLLATAATAALATSLATTTTTAIATATVTATATTTTTGTAFALANVYPTATATTNANTTAIATTTTTATTLAISNATEVKGNVWVTGQRLAAAGEDSWWWRIASRYTCIMIRTFSMHSKTHCISHACMISMREVIPCVELIPEMFPKFRYFLSQIFFGKIFIKKAHL
jgi:hypothetical protein